MKLQQSETAVRWNLQHLRKSWVSEMYLKSSGMERVCCFDKGVTYGAVNGGEDSSRSICARIYGVCTTCFANFGEETLAVQNPR